MHISDGIISTPVCLTATAAAIGLVYLTGRRATTEEIPRMGITGAALFVASLIHFPVAGTSIHLGLFGIAGIILGRRSFPVVFTALLFQALIFQHGGLLTLGVNAINMGTGAFMAWIIWRITAIPEYARAALAGFTGIIVPALLMIAEFRITGYGSAVAVIALIYIIAALIEGGITLSAVVFFRKVKPDILANPVLNCKHEKVYGDD
ncbi:MAG: cobalamin biosynthesis protein CbiM [Bacteroidetes bacterium]|nr:cobalamin biosynthesis protein CbiM [Bacteroidota bacterium]